MYETTESSHDTLALVKDMTYNVRTEVKEIPPLVENVEKMRAEISNLKKEVKRLEERAKSPIICLRVENHSCQNPKFVHSVEKAPNHYPKK
jgi:uncharacterized protein YoxC